MSVFRLQGLERLQIRLEKLAASNAEAAGAAATAGAEHVKSVLVSQFLNGQAIGIVDHALVGGWFVRGQTNPPAGILFTNVPYARAQEYGFQGVVQVKEYRRRKLKKPKRRPKESSRSYSKRVTAFQEDPITSRFDVVVPAHSRAMHLRPHSFLRGAIEASRTSLRKIVFAVWRREIAS